MGQTSRTCFILFIYFLLQIWELHCLKLQEYLLLKSLEKLMLVCCKYCGRLGLVRLDSVRMIGLWDACKLVVQERVTLLCHWISHALKTSRAGGIKLDLIAPIGNIVCFCS
ncbi:hypothetical protein Hanom_Chr15g01360951 [Helianthus anomalus]